MSKPSESAADKKLPPGAEEFAPPADPDRASLREPAAASGPSLGAISPRKNRFMTALLDKLKVNGRPNIDASVGEPITLLEKDSRDGDFYGDPGDGTKPSTAARSDDQWLGETQAASASGIRPMTFTYPPGSKPLAPYTIHRGIGMGGFGEVYFAVSQAGKEVALKRIQRNLEVELRGVSHCLNLKHPNLVALFDICRDDNDQAWVVMEYVAGPNLRQVLDESPDGLPEPEVRRWFSAVASGVNHLHSAGLVHRDLKPGNVFDDLGVVKVGDYGLSKFISASHRGGHTESVGTFHYMAPEIGRGQYGREIDIYALGVMLYEMLTGKVPFDGESCHEIIVKHLTATPDLSGISRPYRSAIARCLEKDPVKRFSTVGELIDALGMSDRVSSGLAAEEVLTAEIVETEQPVEAILVEESESPAVHSKAAERAATPGNAGVNSAACPAHNQSAHNQSAHDEPVARAIRQSFADLHRWWATLDRSPGAKVFLLLVAGFVLLVNTHWLLPLLSFIAIFYVPYYIIRQMVLHVRQQPTYAQAQRMASSVGAGKRPVTRKQWRSYMRNELRAKRSIYRVAELNTSWIAATCTAVGLALGAAVIGLRSGPVDPMAIAPYGWMALVVLISSLGILGMGKLWEQDEGEGLPRRLVLAGVGAGVGVAAYTLNQFLMLPLDAGLARDIDATSMSQALYRDGVPVASAMMAHFALLFAMLRWWKPVDPLRRTRLSLWSVAVAVVAEWAVHQVLPIPQPAGMMVAGGTAIAVQLSAPWINPRALPRVANSPKPVTEPAAARTVA